MCFTDKSCEVRAHDDCEDCLGVEGWSTGFELAGCETEWCDTPPHGKKKCHSLCATVISRICYIQIYTCLPEKVITENLDHKSSMALWCNEHPSSV